MQRKKDGTRVQKRKVPLSADCEWVMGDKSLPDHVRLHVIEMELDKTDPRESPPYRGNRARLNREKQRILRRMEGTDPICVVVGKLTNGRLKYHDLTPKEKEVYRVKKQALRILEEIDKTYGPKWWKRYK